MGKLFYWSLFGHWSYCKKLFFKSCKQDYTESFFSLTSFEPLFWIQVTSQIGFKAFSRRVFSGGLLQIFFENLARSQTFLNDFSRDLTSWLTRHLYFFSNKIKRKFKSATHTKAYKDALRSMYCSTMFLSAKSWS